MHGQSQLVTRVLSAQLWAFGAGLCDTEYMLQAYYSQIRYVKRALVSLPLPGCQITSFSPNIR